jgi:transposase
VKSKLCATSHYWARELTKLSHQVRLMPAKDVKAYVKRNKNDAADAEAICEAVRRPTGFSAAAATKPEMAPLNAPAALARPNAPQWLSRWLPARRARP